MMRSILFLLMTLTWLPAADPSIRHRFLGIGESRPLLIHVDQNDPSKDWQLTLPLKCRDYQLIGGNRILLNADDGYLVYDLGTRALVKEFHDPTLAGTQTVRRTGAGRTLVGSNSKAGIVITELGSDDRVLRTARFPELANLRLMRLTDSGTLLFGCNTDWVAEVGLDGKVVGQFRIPGAKHIYQVLRKPDNHLALTAGYAHFLGDFTMDGTAGPRLGGDAGPPGANFHFWSGFQLLRNGHAVVSTWTGHGANDSTKGWQFAEFAPTGEVVWHWHDSKLAGTMHGIIVLDDLDTGVLNDDLTGILGPVLPTH